MADAGLLSLMSSEWSLRRNRLCFAAMAAKWPYPPPQQHHMALQVEPRGPQPTARRTLACVLEHGKFKTSSRSGEITAAMPSDMRAYSSEALDLRYAITSRTHLPRH
ncbi:unnamed protein product [Lota lota]